MQPSVSNRDVQTIHTVRYVSDRLQFCMDQFHQWMNGNEIMLCRYPLPGDVISVTAILQKHTKAVVTAEYSRNVDDYTYGIHDSASDLIATAFPEHDSWERDGRYLISPIQYPEDRCIYDPHPCPLYSSGDRFAMSLFALTAQGEDTKGPYYQQDTSVHDDCMSESDESCGFECRTSQTLHHHEDTCAESYYMSESVDSSSVSSSDSSANTVKNMLFELI